MRAFLRPGNCPAQPRVQGILGTTTRKAGLSFTDVGSLHPTFGMSARL